MPQANCPGDEGAAIRGQEAAEVAVPAGGRARGAQPERDSAGEPRPRAPHGARTTGNEWPLHPEEHMREPGADGEPRRLRGGRDESAHVIAPCDRHHH
ncbi:hypothetical protein GCM10010294_69810 [Streptomyces griseoloalbus]|nr:hypothetical protein GCM10010294_69810 [Streptomyces griseoloalbus]